MGINPERRREGSDASIVGRSIGDPQAFAVLFDRHFDEIHGFLVRRVGRDRADDLAASTFTVAFERRATFRGQDSARSWLFGIASNLLRNEWRSEQRAIDALWRLTAGTDPGWGGQVEDGGEVVAALLQLDADQRHVVLLHAWEGLSYEEIAVAVGIPVGTVRSRLARARVRLRELLAEHGDEARQTR